MFNNLDLTATRLALGEGSVGRNEMQKIKEGGVKSKQKFIIFPSEGFNFS